MIIVLILMLIGSVYAIPADLWCCTPEMGVFEYINSQNASCRNQKSNVTSPLRLTCPSLHFGDLREGESVNVKVKDSGKVSLFLEFPEIEVDRNEVCLANYTDSNHQIIKLAMICLDKKEDMKVLGYCMLISSIFLLLTSVVYAALPEIRDLQGKSIVNLCGSMGLGVGMLGGTNLTSYPNMISCLIGGYTIYFLLVAAFFWTNAISVQMLLSIRRPVVDNYSWKEFGWYALYAWGCPIILTTCMAIVNYHPGDHQRPGIGFNTCWFNDKTQQWYYMYSVMSILIIANICIFIYTSIQLWRLSFCSNQVKALRYKFIMTLRMFFIMGISWIFEMISSLTVYNVIWFIIDIFNTLQGPVVFLVIVVFRKRVLRALLKRGYVACIAGLVERYLDDKDDEEEAVIQDTYDVTMNNRDQKDGN